MIPFDYRGKLERLRDENYVKVFDYQGKLEKLRVENYLKVNKLKADLYAAINEKYLMEQGNITLKELAEHTNSSIALAGVAIAGSLEFGRFNVKI